MTKPFLSLFAIYFVASLAVRFGLPALGALLIGAYGALGLDGLQHYTLALCSEHTFVARFTIWSEAAAGLALALASALLATRDFREGRT